MVAQDLNNITIENIYTSVGCNRISGSFDWGNNGLILFCACNSVALLDPKYANNASKILKTFLGHKNAVNVVKWIRNGNQSETQFISGSNDMTSIIWTISLSDFTISKRIHLNDHQAAVTMVETIVEDNDRIIVATATIDAVLRLWRKSDTSDDEYLCFQLFNMKHLCLACRAFRLSNNDHSVFAIATDDNCIRLLGRTKDENTFDEVEKLVGHEDWVKSLDAHKNDNGEILLASSSEDTYIRLWKIYQADQDETMADDGLLKQEEKTFSVLSSDGTHKKFTFSLESVLSGHDAWVTEVNWSQNCDSESPLLLSSSIDKTIVIWQQSDIGVWMEKVRVGDVGGNTLGFLGGKFSPNGQSILGHGFQGSLQMWHQFGDDDRNWTPGVVVSGHFGQVRDLSWEPKGEFLFSVSADQTTRIHAPWKRENSIETWHELARPQIHGYDMQAIVTLERYRFASCAEEKIVRTFKAPGNFVENLQRICGIVDDEGKVILNSKAKGASVPSLGLSNKEVFSATEQTSSKNQYDNADSYFTPVFLTEPPAEVTLMQNTLWPEMQKLYGHGYDVYALAATSDGKILASACKATNSDDAHIILWNTNTWKQIQKLYSHILTVTQMKFSADNKCLLSVSRDRRWSVFENQCNEDTGEYNFQLIGFTEKKNGIHTRIIWSCDWSHDSKWFVTSSRDGKVAAWYRSNSKSDSSLGYYRMGAVLELQNESVTAVAVAQKCWKDDQYLVAIGLESGGIILYNFIFNEVNMKCEWTKLNTIDESYSHHLTVKKVAFNVVDEKVKFASCGDDNCVRIFNVF